MKEKDYLPKGEKISYGQSFILRFKKWRKDMNGGILLNIDNTNLIQISLK